MLPASSRPGGSLPWNQRGWNVREREEGANVTVRKDIVWHDSMVRKFYRQECYVLCLKSPVKWERGNILLFVGSILDFVVY